MPRRRAPLTALVVWLVATAAGAVVVALPDEGPRVLSLSETHGPSLADLGGIAVAVGAWLWFVAVLWRVRAAIRLRWLPAIAAAAGAALVGWSVSTDTGSWWVIGIVLLVAAQAAAALSASRNLPDGR